MKRIFWVAITLALAAYVLMPLPGDGAPLGNRIDTTKNKIKHKRYKEAVLSDTISGYNVKIRGLQGEIRGLQERQNRIQGTLDEKRAELLDVRNRLEIARDRLVRLKADLATAEKALAARLVELYKADEPDVLTVVLQSDGFADLLERTEFLQRVSEQDKRIVTRVRVLKAQAAKQNKQLGVLEGQAQKAAEVILAKRNELAASKGRLVRARGGLQSTRDGRKNILAQVRSSRVRLEGDLKALEAEQARVQNALRNAQGNTFGGAQPVKRGSGQLIWPVSGPVVSPFGMRWGRLHAGIDIAVPAGTPIRAADGGRVVLLGWTGGYGNYTCVQHTGSMSTCYAHQSSYATSMGAAVSQGQVIGSVGCTGHCFGDHLHFEVRINGAPVNPMGYL
jgi:murein DD-endopeptidase MepM/ murein hydrolase activator NlpD